MNSSITIPAQPNTSMHRILSYLCTLFCASVILSGCVVYESSLRSRGGTPQYQTQQQQPYYQNSPNSGYPNSGYPSNQGYSNQPPPNQNFPNTQVSQQQGYSDINWQQGRNTQVTFQHFYDELYPYGEWLNVPQHGYVWRPYNVDANWQPYLTNGRWTYTRYGWTWVSNYAWGWAPFHYGRWQLDSFYGWYWIPGDVWGPAWVEWRFYEGNYWWVPLAPGVGFGANFAGGRYAPRSWNVVPAQYLMDPFCQNYALRYSQFGRNINNTRIINNTYVVNNVTYPAGPSADDVSRYVGGKVVPLALRNQTQAGAGVVTGNDVSVYAPSVLAPTQNSDAGKARPMNFTPASRATQGKAGIYNEGQNENTPAAPATDVGSKSRPTQMPTPMEPSVQPQINSGKKSASPFEQQPSTQPASDGTIPRISRPRTMPQVEQEQQVSPVMRKSVPSEQPQPVQERKANPFEQPRNEQPRNEQPRQAIPQSSQERKSNPFEQPRNETPRNEQPRNEQPRHESSKSIPQSILPSTPPPNVPQTSTGKKGGGD